MFKIIHDFISKFHVTNWQADILVSFVFVALFMMSVIIIGIICNYLEQLQIRLVSKYVGQTFAIFIFNRVLFIGTVIHELSHAFFAWISGAKVTKVRCLTLFSKDTLGYCEFIPRGNIFVKSFQLAFASCAPTVTGCFILYLCSRYFTSFSSLGKVIIFYVGLSVLNHMSMSSQDVKNYIKGSICMYIIIFVFTMAYHHFYI